MHRKKHLEYIDFLKEKTGLSLSALAKAAGLADSTLTRFQAKDEFKRLSTSTLDRLAEVAGFDSYEDYLIETHQQDAEAEEVNIEDSTKFATYESVKRLLSKKTGSSRPNVVSAVSQEVLNHAYRLKTDFISDSLIMYVIERMELENRLK